MTCKFAPTTCRFALTTCKFTLTTCKFALIAYRFALITYSFKTLGYDIGRDLRYAEVGLGIRRMLRRTQPSSIPLKRGGDGSICFCLTWGRCQDKAVFLAAGNEDFPLVLAQFPDIHVEFTEAGVFEDVPEQSYYFLLCRVEIEPPVVFDRLGRYITNNNHLLSGSTIIYNKSAVPSR